MKKILVISDSHISSFDQFPEEIKKLMNEVDLIIHCGDYTSYNVVKELKNFSNFYGVVGNADDYKIEEELNKELIIKVEKVKIAVAHPFEGGPPMGIKYKLLEKFMNEHPDIILFGHTHFAEFSEYNKIKFFNPGSSTGKLPALFKSYGLIEIERDKINAGILKI